MRVAEKTFARFYFLSSSLSLHVFLLSLVFSLPYLLIFFILLLRPLVLQDLHLPRLLLLSLLLLLLLVLLSLSVLFPLRYPSGIFENVPPSA